MPTPSDVVALPWRGLGLSSNLDAAEQPNPYRVHARHPGLFDFVEYSAPLELAEAQAQASLFPTLWAQRETLPVLFHPVHLNLWGPELQDVDSLRALDAHARAVGSAWVGNDVGWWHAGGEAFPGYLFIAPPMDARGLEDCVAHAQHVQAHLSVPLVLENPVVFARRGDRHVLDFMGQLHARTGCPLLLDLGHLWSYQLAAGLNIDAGLDGFPLEQVIEIHLAGGVVHRRGGRGFYVDDHTQPVREEVLLLLESLLPRLPNLRAVTFEGDGHPLEAAVSTLKRLRRLVPAAGRPDVELPRALGAEVSGYASGSAPWELFRQVHAGEGGEDPEGLEAESDFRMAVLAEQLDVRWRLTRLLLAGTREGLRRFATSPEYLDLYRPGARGLEVAFLAWAQRTLREEERPEVSGVLAFELAADALSRQPPLEPRVGELGLSAEVRWMSHPVDLGELLFAARALERHLTARGWATGVVEQSGLEALAQVAARCPAEPWELALERWGSRWRPVQVSPEERTAMAAAAARLPLSKLEEIAPADTWRALRRRGWLQLRSA